MLIICGLLQASLMVITLVYFWLLFATRRWIQADGLIVTSRVHSSTTGGVHGSDTEVVNMPLVEYEYRVNNQKFRSDRIMIGYGKSASELERVLNRYPLGAKVIVYYNPAAPQQAVLERFPVARIRGCGILMLFPFGVQFLTIQIYQHSADRLSAFFDASPLAFGFAAAGLVILARTILLTGKSLRASTWPTTSGRITVAQVEDYSTDTPGVTRSKPTILYTYTVDGRNYRSGRVWMTVGFSSHITHLPTKMLAKYPVGTQVIVRYNPKWPSAAVLHIWSARQVEHWLASAALFILAWMLTARQ